MEFTLQIDEVAVDPHGNDGTVGAEEIQSGKKVKDKQIDEVFAKYVEKAQ